MVTRLCKIVLVSAVALFAWLVGINNITDYGSNFAFVQHVMSMDTTFEGNKLMWRAIVSPNFHHAAYFLIIFLELLTGTLCSFGAYRLILARNEDQQTFVAAKTIANLGLTTGIVLWFSGFLTVGAEWFVMWQSDTWNGQQAAFRFVVVLFGVLIFLNQKD
tara:strand:- start:288 stop:770 length:483 start_codon:yes stop_codon:yes gene_type:complete